MNKSDFSTKITDSHVASLLKLLPFQVRLKILANKRYLLRIYSKQFSLWKSSRSLMATIFCLSCRVLSVNVTEGNIGNVSVNFYSPSIIFLINHSEWHLGSATFENLSKFLSTPLRTKCSSKYSVEVICTYSLVSLMLDVPFRVDL